MWGNQAGLLTADDTRYPYGYQPEAMPKAEQLALLERAIDQAGLSHEHIERIRAELEKDFTR